MDSEILLFLIVIAIPCSISLIAFIVMVLLYEKVPAEIINSSDERIYFHGEDYQKVAYTVRYNLKYKYKGELIQTTVRGDIISKNGYIRCNKLNPRKLFHKNIIIIPLIFAALPTFIFLYIFFNSI